MQLRAGRNQRVRFTVGGQDRWPAYGVRGLVGVILMVAALVELCVERARMCMVLL